MTIGTILFGIALLGLVGLYVARPLLQPRIRRPRVSSHDRLLAEKEAALFKIQSLDFDYETGKLDESTYQQQRELLMSDARSILIQLDETELIEEKASRVARRDLPDEDVSDIDNDIELAVSMLRKQHAELDNALEGRAATTYTSKNGGSHYCSHCGKPLDEGDKFCAFCGQAVKRPQSHEPST